MKVPYAERWQKETDKLRKIVLACGLTEELKWGKPRFTFQEKTALTNFIHEAIEIEKPEKKVVLKKASDYVVPEELQARLNAAPKLKAAFEALTPGRRKSYIFHISGAKQPKTRAARASRCVPMILSGRWLKESTA
jgi:uncharacterized protein YdeI (YjbR/CyaY-like superfamily)